MAGWLVMDMHGLCLYVAIVHLKQSTDQAKFLDSTLILQERVINNMLHCKYDQKAFSF